MTRLMDRDGCALTTFAAAAAAEEEEATSCCEEGGGAGDSPSFVPPRAVVAATLDRLLLLLLDLDDRTSGEGDLLLLLDGVIGRDWDLLRDMDLVDRPPVATDCEASPT
mmetsp:Transcript_12790/g.27582  ORF Transcript_12790/g.27582 Transcript_12790/m.27582 type:complete len:109 (-) Transcript_12790:942-1268(-)